MRPRPNPVRSLVLTVAFASAPVFAYARGVVGYSGFAAGPSCVACHTAGTGTAPTVVIAGPATLLPGATGQYTLTVSGGPGVRAGMNLGKDVVGGQLQGDGSTTQSSAGEIAHKAAQSFVGGAAVFHFRLVAPAVAGTVRLYGSGNSTNGNGSTSGDREMLTVFTVNVTAANAAPTVATGAAAAQTTVATTQVDLSVLGADDQAEAALTYTWAATGPAAVTFSASGNNAAKATTASFTRAGSYTLTATIRDAAGLTVTSAVPVSVRQTLSQLVVSPSSAAISPSTTQQFTAAGSDQFGQPLTLTPAWAVSGGGTISAAGLFSGDATQGGPFVVSASASGLRSTAQVSIGSGAVTVVPPAVRIVGPFTGEKVKGLVHLKLEAVAAAGLVSTELVVDGTRVALLTQAPFELELDTEQFADGSHTLDAAATDSAGNVARAETIRLYFRNSDAPAEEVAGTVDFGCSSSGSSLLFFALSALVPLLRKGAHRTRP